MHDERPPLFEALGMPLLAALTLGLAPFTPEPHLVEKLRWVATGGAGMAPLDVFDLLMHGAPWVWLAWAGWRWGRPPRVDDQDGQGAT